MKTIAIKDIQISPNRQRREFPEKELNELKESIQARGLFHPITLRWHHEFANMGTWFLVSGERRLRAISDIYALGGSFLHDGEAVQLDHIPFVNLGDLDELAREEAELEENIRRSDLSWQERASATARLASLRERQGLATGTELVRLVARETKSGAADLPTGYIGVHQELTRRELIVAKHLADPEVKAAKGVDEAFKILRRKEDTAKRVQLAAEIGRTYSAGTAHRALNEDSLSWMSKAEANQFDVICTDPIYGIGADEFGDSGGKAAGAHFYKDDYETWKAHALALSRDGFRITKVQAHLYAFCDITHFEEFKAILSAAGWNPFRTPLIWHKPNGSRTPWVDQGPQRKYEIILYANKGKKPVTRIYPDLFTYAADENLGHQAQKPIALYTDLLRRSVSPGDCVLDPFAGSGPILPAAHELQLQATAIEIDAAAYALCVGRIKGLEETPELEGL